MSAESSIRIQSLEHQLAFEQERARIAQDIHDDIGASLTRIQLLGQVVEEELGKAPKSPEARTHSQSIAATARDVAQRMDEIVWAVNPEHDTLASFADYVCHAAPEILQLAGIRCRLDVLNNVPELHLSSEVRHNLYLLIREALHNVLKHSGAAAVIVRMRHDGGKLRIAVEDNGRGFDSERLSGGGNGLRNMRQRAERLGGECRMESAPGLGTKTMFEIPLG